MWVRKLNQSSPNIGADVQKEVVSLTNNGVAKHLPVFLAAQDLRVTFSRMQHLKKISSNSRHS
jgi:hypothetical protein